MKTNNTTQTNNSTWTQTKLWMMSVLTMGVICGVIYLIIIYSLAYYALVTVMGGILTWRIKGLIELIGEWYVLYKKINNK